MTGRPQQPAVRRDCSHDGRHQHGTVAAYKDDWCRCADCRAACAADWRERSRAKAYGRHQPQHVDPTATVRRLRALAAVGWSPKMLAELVDVQKTHLAKLRAGNMTFVRVTTELAVSEIYDELWDRKPPMRTRDEKGAYARTVRFAAAAGWLPPLAWDDDTIGIPDQIKPVVNIENHVIRSVPDYADLIMPGLARSRRCSTARRVDEMAVARFIAGDSVPLNRAEVSDAVVTMTGMGKSAKEIAERLGITQRSVVRHRAAARRKEAA